MLTGISSKSLSYFVTSRKCEAKLLPSWSDWIRKWIPWSMPCGTDTDHQHQSQSHRSQRPGREFHQPRRRDRWDGSEKKCATMGTSRVEGSFTACSSHLFFLSSLRLRPLYCHWPNNLFKVSSPKIKLFDFSIFGFLSFTALNVLFLLYYLLFWFQFFSEIT